MTERRECIRKKHLEVFLLLDILRKQKKLKVLSKGSLNFSGKDVLRLKQKTTLFPDSDIYIPDVIHRTLKEVHT